MFLDQGCQWFNKAGFSTAHLLVQIFRTVQALNCWSVCLGSGDRPVESDRPPDPTRYQSATEAGGHRTLQLPSAATRGAAVARRHRPSHGGQVAYEQGMHFSALVQQK